jgi:hypothetical protein
MQGFSGHHWPDLWDYRLYARDGIFLLVAFAGKNGKARVFREARIGDREFAENEHGTAIRFEEAGVSTISAKASVFRFLVWCRRFRHKSSIAATP